MSADHDDQIRERAYGLWEQAGKPAGRHQEFWLLAEKQMEDKTLDVEIADSFPASDSHASTMRKSSAD